MGSLKIRQVIYRGENYEFKSPLLDNKIVMVEGDNGTGKTTFCNLIYFGLGGYVDEFNFDSDKRHAQITSDKNNFVDLHVAISGEDYILRRSFGDNEILVVPQVTTVEQDVEHSEETLSEEELSEEVHLEEELSDGSLSTDVTSSALVFPLRRRQDSITFSDWIMEKLEISVVEIYQGSRSFKVGFNDLLRLMYHDQEPDPNAIFKKLEKDRVDWIADSETLRKSIFELLVGRSYSEYYNALSEFRKADRELQTARSLVEEYAKLAQELRGNTEQRNTSFLQAEIQENQAQIQKLLEAREALKRNRTPSQASDSGIADLKNAILEGELELGELKEALLAVLDERYKAESVRQDTLHEIAQINKVIHTHDQLNLFTSDTWSLLPQRC